MTRLLAAMVLAVALAGCSALTDDDGEADNPNALRCTTPTDASPSLGATFNVRFGEHTTIAGEGLTLAFDQFLGDSRCAQPMTCIVAGQVEIVVEAEHPPSAAALLELSSNSLPDSRGTYSQYEVQLVNVLPYPEVGRTSEPSDYCAQLRVVRAE